MPRQSLIAMKVAFGIRTQYATIALIATFMITQAIGALIFSGSAQAVGSISYSSTIRSLSNDTLNYDFDKDSAGNVYVASGPRITKYTSAGVFVKYWGGPGNGDGELRSNRLAVDASDNVYVLDYLNNRVQKFTSNGDYVSQFGSIGTGNGQFNFDAPSSCKGGIDTDTSGNIYVGDAGNSRIQKFSSSGSYIDQFNYDGSLGCINSIGVSPDGDIYVADNDSLSDTGLHKFNASFVYQSDFTPFISYKMGGMDFDAAGNIFIASTDATKYYVYTSGGTLYYDANNYMGATYDVLLDQDGSLYTMRNAPWGSSVGQINKIELSSNHILATFANAGDGVLGHGRVKDTAIAPDGSLYVCSTAQIQHYSAAGLYLSSFGVDGTEDGQFHYCTSLAIAPDGSVYVTDAGNARVQKFTATGAYVSQWGGFGPQAISSDSIAVNIDTSVYVADQGSSLIQKFDSSGTYLAQFGSEGTGNGQFSNSIGGIATDKLGNIYVVDRGNHRVQKFDSSGTYLAQFGSEGTGDGQFLYPFDIATDTAGNVLVSDVYRGDVQKFAGDGTYIAKFGSNGSSDGQFNFNESGYDPESSLSVSDNGKIYVTDTDARVQVFTDNSFDLRLVTEPATNITDVLAMLHLQTSDNADTQAATYSFDYGQTTSYGSNVTAATSGFALKSTFGPTGGGSGDGQINAPADVVQDSDGNMYILDSGNCRVQKFDASGNFILKWGSCGGATYGVYANGEFSNGPQGIALDKFNNVYVVDYDGSSMARIQKFDSTGNFILKWGTRGYNNPGQFVGPSSVAIAPNGDVYVLDNGNSRVQVFDSQGTYKSEWTQSASATRSMVINSQGIVYIGGSGSVYKYDLEGNYLGLLAPNGTAAGSIYGAYRVDLDQYDNLYVIDASSSRAQVFNSSGVYKGFISSGEPGDTNLEGGFKAGSVVRRNGDIAIINSNSIGGYELPTATVYKRSIAASTSTGTLSCGTAYHYRAKAQVGSEVVYGADQTFTTASCASPMTITTTTLEDGTRNIPYSDTIEVADAAGAVAYSISSGQLPDGLSLNTTTGEISGTPTQTQSYPAYFTITADDGVTSVDKALSIDVVGFTTIQIVNGISDNMYIGQPFEYTVHTHGGFGMPTFTVVAGSLPPGVTMDSTGYISGTPTTEGFYAFTVRATDLSGYDERSARVPVYNSQNNPSNSALISITSPTANTTLEHDSVVISGTGPASSNLTVWMDGYQLGTTPVDSSGNWSYFAQNIFPGSHTFDAKWNAQGSLAIVPATLTFASPNSTVLNVVDTGTDKIIKKFYTDAIYPYIFDTVISTPHNKAYLEVFDGATTGIQQLDLASGKSSLILQGLQSINLNPIVLTISDDGQTVYVVTDSELITYDVGQQQLARRNLPTSVVDDSEVLLSRAVVSADKRMLYLGWPKYNDSTGLSSRMISIVNLQTLEVTKIDLGEAYLKNGFTTVDRIDNSVYILYGDGVMEVIDVTTGQVTSSINMNLTGSNNTDPFASGRERVISSALDKDHKLMYVNVVGQDYTELRSVNLETEQINTLSRIENDGELLGLLAFDSFSKNLYIHSQAYGSNNLQFNKFNLQTNSFASGAGYPIIDETPGVTFPGFNNNWLYRQSQGLTASTSFTVPLPPVVNPPVVKPPVTPKDPAQPTITDVTPAPSSTKPPKASTIANSRNAGASPNSLFALARRIPESFAIAFPWLLLLLALILVSMQYYQVRSESLATAKLQASVQRQERLVDEQNNFVALSTHYLHTPLTVMEGEITLMVRAGTLTQAQATKLKATLSSLNSEAEAVLNQEEQNELDV